MSIYRTLQQQSPARPAQIPTTGYTCPTGVVGWVAALAQAQEPVANLCEQMAASVAQMVVAAVAVASAQGGAAGQAACR